MNHTFPFVLSLHKTSFNRNPVCRVWALFCALGLTFMLVACGGSGGSDSGADSGSDSGGGSGAPKPADPNLTANVSWTIPTERENGDALDLSEIDGYEIYYRNVNDELYTVVIVTDPTASEYEVTDLEAGTYEFKIAVYDTEGVFSVFSRAQRVEISSG